MTRFLGLFLSALAVARPASAEDAYCSKGWLSDKTGMWMRTYSKGWLSSSYGDCYETNNWLGETRVNGDVAFNCKHGWATDYCTGQGPREKGAGGDQIPKMSLGMISQKDIFCILHDLLSSSRRSVVILCTVILSILFWQLTGELTCAHQRAPKGVCTDPPPRSLLSPMCKEICEVTRPLFLQAFPTLSRYGVRKYLDRDQQLRRC